MKRENIFDALENAEESEMNRLSDKCPELSGQHIDKLLEMSERKYNANKKGNMSETTEGFEVVVTGVEHYRRTWLKPVCAAASFILIAAAAVGGACLLNKNMNHNSDDIIQPSENIMTEVSTETGTAQATVSQFSTETSTAAVTTQEQTASEAVESAAEADTQPVAGSIEGDDEYYMNIAGELTADYELLMKMCSEFSLDLKVDINDTFTHTLTDESFTPPQIELTYARIIETIPNMVGHTSSGTFDSIEDVKELALYTLAYDDNKGMIDSLISSPPPDENFYNMGSRLYEYNGKLYKNLTNSGGIALHYWAKSNKPVYVYDITADSFKVTKVTQSFEDDDWRAKGIVPTDDDYYYEAYTIVRASSDLGWKVKSCEYIGQEEYEAIAAQQQQH